jgi:hypothetical protein
MLRMGNSYLSPLGPKKTGRDWSHYCEGKWKRVEDRIPRQEVLVNRQNHGLDSGAVYNCFLYTFHFPAASGATSLDPNGLGSSNGSLLKMDCLSYYKRKGFDLLMEELSVRSPSL